MCIRDRNIADDAPLDKHSIPSEPVPANKSNTLLSIISVSYTHLLRVL